MGTLLYEALTYKIVGVARGVYYELGPGYLESVYEDALCYEFDLLKIPYQRQVDLDIHYKDVDSILVQINLICYEGFVDRSFRCTSV